MTFLSSFLLGLVQGIAEFLPISSSGHLAIAQNLLGMSDAGTVPEFFDVLLHLGTLVAVFVAYWADIKDMVLEFFRGAGDLIHHSTPNPVPPARRLILLIILGIYSVMRYCQGFAVGSGYRSFDDNYSDIVSIPIKNGLRLEIGWIVRQKYTLSDTASRFVDLLMQVESVVL